MQIMSMRESQKIMILRISCASHESYENQIIPYAYHAHHEILRKSFGNLENH